MTETAHGNGGACSPVRDLLPLFFDGELEPEVLGRIAAHSSNCAECAREISALDRLHLLVKGAVEAEADRVDTRELWHRIEQRLPRVRSRWRERLRVWWQEAGWQPTLAWSAGALAVAALAIGLYWSLGDESRPQARPVQLAASASPNVPDVPAEIQQIETDYPLVTVLNDEAQSATVIWVSDEGLTGGQR